MGLIGIGKGLFKLGKGIIEGDGEELLKGAGKIVKGVIGLVVFGGDSDDDDDDVLDD